MKTNSQGFAALFILTAVSFTLFYLLVVSSAASFESRQTFLYQTAKIEADSVASTCIDMLQFGLSQDYKTETFLEKTFEFPDSECEIYSIDAQGDNKWKVEVTGVSRGVSVKKCAEVTPSSYQSCPNQAF